MRESRTYGSGRGACDETHVPTATRAASFAARWSPSLGGRSHGGCVRARSTQPNIDLGCNQQHAERNEERAYGPCDEYGEIAARDQHGPAKILLEARSEHETERRTLVYLVLTVAT